MLSFTMSEYDGCLYVKRSGRNLMYILDFKDDILICSNDISEIQNIQGGCLGNSLLKRWVKLGPALGLR